MQQKLDGPRIQTGDLTMAALGILKIFRHLIFFPKFSIVKAFFFLEGTTDLRMRSSVRVLNLSFPLNWNICTTYKETYGVLKDFPHTIRHYTVKLAHVSLNTEISKIKMEKGFHSTLEPNVPLPVT